MKKIENPRDKIIIKVPKGEPIACHEDQAGMITIYVMTEEEMMTDYAHAMCERIKKRRHSQLELDIFGSDDDDYKVSNTQTSVREKCDEYVEFDDPSTTLMDGDNMHKRMSPHIATKIWKYPHRTWAITEGWKPTDEHETQKTESQLWCWNDCHTFSNRPFRMPWSENTKDGTWSVVGYFCSPSCARSFNGKWNVFPADRAQRDALIFKLAMQSYGYSYIPKKGKTWNANSVIPVAPDVLLLREFGGPLTIDEFRKYNVSGCELHISLEYPYIIIPQIAVEKSALSQGNNHGIYIQRAESMKTQLADPELAPCCKANQCKKTFTEIQRRKEMEIKESQSSKTEEAAGTSLLNETKRLLWQKRRKQHLMYRNAERSRKRQHRQEEEENRSGTKVEITKRENEQHPPQQHASDEENVQTCRNTGYKQLRSIIGGSKCTNDNV
ncbi:MAG: hypothetical protein PHN45_01955 [Methylococcales bacterium]|nr:hypothetical protein [Methylococcales bacterium]